jgi:hypothetical protein
MIRSLRFQSAAAAASTALLTLFGVACRPAPELAPTVWPSGATNKEMVRHLAAFLDDQVGKPFPDLVLTDPRTGRVTTLFETAKGKCLVLNFLRGCPSIKRDLEYFESIGWQVPDIDSIVVLASERNASDYLKMGGPTAPIMTTDLPLSSWLSRLHASPQTFFVDCDTRRLERWGYHLEAAQQKPVILDPIGAHFGNQEVDTYTQEKE